VNKESKPCQGCPVQSEWCIPERKSDVIIENFRDKASSADEKGRKVLINEAKQRVSSLTQEARQLGCPRDEFLRIRRETLGQIDPKLEEADKRVHIADGFFQRIPDIAAAYTHERSIDALSGESYDRYLRNTRGRRTRG